MCYLADTRQVTSMSQVKHQERRWWHGGVGVTLAVLLALAACQAGASSVEVRRDSTLTVFAAASLKDAFETIAQQFVAANGGVDVVYNFAGSQQLAQQLAEGAPADVFAAASARSMQSAVDAGRIVSETVRLFTANRLVIIFPKGNPAALRTMQDLARPGVKLVLAAAVVPAGEYTLDFLAKAAADPGFEPAYSELVLANVVSYEDNVRGVLNKVALGEADAGIVYQSDVSSATGQEVGTIDIPDALNVIATYLIAALDNSTRADLAHRFVAFVLSDVGQTILQRYGFSAVQQEQN